MFHLKNRVTAWIVIGLALFALVQPSRLLAEPAKPTDRQLRYLANLHELEILHNELRRMSLTSPKFDEMKQKIAALESYQRGIKMLIDHYGDEVVGSPTEPAAPAGPASSNRALVPVEKSHQLIFAEGKPNDASDADPDFDQEKLHNLPGERSARYLNMKLHESRLEKEHAELKALPQNKRPADYARKLADKEAAQRRVKQKIAAFEADYDLRRGARTTAQDHARSAFHSTAEIDRQIQQFYGQIRPINSLETLENNLKAVNEIRVRIMARHLLQPYPVTPDNEFAHRMDHAEWCGRFGVVPTSADEYVRRVKNNQTHLYNYWRGKLEATYRQAGILDPEILKNARMIDQERSSGRFAVNMGQKLSPRNCILGALGLAATGTAIPTAIGGGGMAIMDWLSGDRPTLGQTHFDQAKALYEERLFHPCSRTEKNICEKIEDLEVFCYRVKQAYHEQCVPH